MATTFALKRLSLPAALLHGSRTRRGPPEQESMQSIVIAVVAEGFGTGQMLLGADKKKLHGNANTDNVAATRRCSRDRARNVTCVQNATVKTKNVRVQMQEIDAAGIDLLAAS